MCCRQVKKRIEGRKEKEVRERGRVRDRKRRMEEVRRDERGGKGTDLTNLKRVGEQTARVSHYAACRVVVAV